MEVWNLLPCLLLLFTPYVLAVGDRGDMDNSTAANTTTAPPTPMPKPTQPPDTSRCPDPPAVSGGPPLPKLDDQFETRVECTITQDTKEYTTDIIEYYDYINNKGAVYKVRDGVTSQWLYDFQRVEFFLVTGDQCSNVDMASSGFHFFNFSMAGDGKGHIGSVSDLFNFGTTYGESYVDDNQEIRGIPVNHWKSCIQWASYNKTIFDLDYYFSKPDYATPVGKRVIPVRIKLTGKAPDSSVPSFHHYYDFVSYRPGNISDPTVFEVPQGVVCASKKRDDEKTRPVIPDSFSCDIETVQVKEKFSSNVKHFYDYASNLSRMDVKPSRKSQTQDEYINKYGYNPTKLVHDYNMGLEYAIDMVWNNCTVSKIPKNTLDADSADPAHIVMRHGSNLFDLNVFNFSYQGQRTMREIECDIWAAQMDGYPGDGTTSTIEVYFARDGWVSEVETKTEKNALVGMWMRTTDKTTKAILNEFTSYVYDYRASEPDMNAFDIRFCYDDPKHLQHRMFRIQGKYEDIVSRKTHDLYPAVKKALYGTMKVEPIRITDIFFDSGPEDDYVDVWFTILEKPTVIENVKGDSPVSLKDALKALKDVINEGWSIKVNYKAGQQTLMVKKGYLVSEKDAFDPRNSPPVCAKPHTGYSSGSMAGLAFAMLFIGLLAGFGIAFYLWRRNARPNIPYQVQD